MKRGLRWSDDDTSSSSSSDDDDVKSNKSHTSQPSKLKPNQVDSTNKKKKGVDFEALSQHGYRGGLSVLGVPQPKVQENWTWSKGEETRSKEEEESFAERQKTRHTIADAEEIANIKTQEKKNLSFQQKEKRKRDLGQASRGKNYVEEEKRLLRDNGVYSGFDS